MTLDVLAFVMHTCYITVFVANVTVIDMLATVFAMHVTVRAFVMHYIVSRTPYIYGGTDSLEKQSDLTGPITPRRKAIWPSVKYVDDFKNVVRNPFHPD